MKLQKRPGLMRTWRQMKAESLLLMKRKHPNKLQDKRATVVQREAEHLHQVIRFLIDNVNDAIDNEESINNIKDCCGNRKISAHQVECWYKNYYCQSKDYNKLMTKIIEKKKFQKNNQQSSLLQLQHDLFSELK